MPEVLQGCEPESPPVEWVDTGSWSRYSRSEVPRVLIFSDRREGAALGGHMTCKLSPAGHTPHGPLRVTQAGYPQLGLRELVQSGPLMKKWLEELPNTTILDVGKSDLSVDWMRGQHYHRYIVLGIGAMEDSARDLISNPADAIYWRNHMDLHHKYIVVAPGMVSNCGTALQRLAEYESSLLANNILTCSAYRHLYPVGARQDPWTLSPQENSTLNLAIHEAIWRVHCPARINVEYKSRERLQRYVSASVVCKPHHFCHYEPIREVVERARSLRRVGS